MGFSNSTDMSNFKFTAEAQRARRKRFISFAFERPRRNGMQAKANKKIIALCVLPPGFRLYGPEAAPLR